MTKFLQELDTRWACSEELIKSILKCNWINSNESNRLFSILNLSKGKRVIFGIAGPGASGKTTVLNNLYVNYKFHHLLNVTTRLPRDNEKNGVDYYFLTKEEFNKNEYNNSFFSTVEKSGRGKYGFYRKDILSIINNKDLKNIVVVESPLVLSNLFEFLLYKTNEEFVCNLLYLIPSPPIIHNLIKFLNNRQSCTTMEEININHGWRQIEEFCSIISVGKNINTYVLEGFEPNKLSSLLGEIYM